MTGTKHAGQTNPAGEGEEGSPDRPTQGHRDSETGVYESDEETSPLLAGQVKDEAVDRHQAAGRA